MITIEEIGINWIDFIVLAIIGVAIFVFTYFLYPPLIKWIKQRGWVGYDIHKKARPATAESGGIGLTIGMIVGIVIVAIIYIPLRHEAIAFLATIMASAIIGFVDDRKQLSSIRKIVLMIATGIPLFLLNLFGYITIASPTLPFLGQLRLTIIYPLIVPFIITIMTNTVNMLEGYNGEGSGTTMIATVFIIFAAVIVGSAQGLIFGVPVLAAIAAFFMFNKYPAKVFPGDIGTLVIGAALALLGILGSLEFIMIIAVLTQVFNSFYVITSVRGFKESHEITKKDILLDNEDNIHASHERGAPLTLPRLILAFGKLSEWELVKNFMALAFISGNLAVISVVFQNLSLTLNGGVGLEISLIIACILLSILTVIKFPRTLGIALLMGFIVAAMFGLFYIIDIFIVSNPFNLIYSAVLAVIILGVWYWITIKYFWYVVERMDIEYHPEEERE